MTQFDAFADFRMNNHHVIITGGAQNIGAGIAKILASAGANVMIADLQGDKAKETAANIEAETGGHCRGMACDVTKSEDINAVVAATVEAFGGISTLINNVGWGARHENPTAISDKALIDSYKLNTISAGSNAKKLAGDRQHSRAIAKRRKSLNNPMIAAIFNCFNF